MRPPAHGARLPRHWEWRRSVCSSSDRCTAQVPLRYRPRRFRASPKNGPKRMWQSVTTRRSALPFVSPIACRSFCQIRAREQSPRYMPDGEAWRLAPRWRRSAHSAELTGSAQPISSRRLDPASDRAVTLSVRNCPDSSRFILKHHPGSFKTMRSGWICGARLTMSFVARVLKRRTFTSRGSARRAISSSSAPIERKRKERAGWRG